MAMETWQPGWGTKRRRPFREMEEMERLMESSFGMWPLGLRWRRVPGEEIAWAPAICMFEKEDNFVVRAELPGVNKADVNISVTGDTLTIDGDRKPPADVKDEEYYRCEMCYGSFSRSITLPAAVDADKIEATFENGILEISLPKAREAKPAKIQIKTK